MLQFGGILSNSTTRLTPPRKTWCRITLQLLNSTLSQADPIVQSQEKEKKNVNNELGKSKLIVNALKETNVSNKNNNNVKFYMNRSIFDAVDYIFTGIEKSSYAPDKVLEAFTILGDMMKFKKVDPSRIINDTRFITVLNNLAENSDINKSVISKEDKLLSLSNKINDHLSTYILILQAMGSKKMRNLPVLKSTVDAIVHLKQHLNIKKATDILYSLCAMNFPHEELIKKICHDIIEEIPDTKKNSAIRSILTSLGRLQFKDPQLLDVISEWFVKNWENLQCDDIIALMMTLAILNYIPKNSDVLIKNHVMSLKKEDMVLYEQWLNLVWSLTVLNRATPEQISTVLDDSFLSVLTDLQFAGKQKLWNINAAAKLIYKDSYKGSFLDENSAKFSLQLTHRSEKINHVKSVLDPLKSIMPTTAVINTNVDKNLGFLLDIECLLDQNSCRTILSEPSKEYKVPIKIAFITQGYYDFTRGTKSLTGISALQYKLIKCKGYKIIEIPFTDFDMNSKLITRLKYLRNQLLNTLLEGSN